MKWLWRKIYWTYRRWRDYFFMSKTERQIRRQQSRSYDHLTITGRTEHLVSQIGKFAREINGEDWNYYSDALRRENVFVFEQVVGSVRRGGRRRLSYLEIGSAQGLSMALVGKLLVSEGATAQLMSIDPYPGGGYREGARGIYGVERHVRIGKETRDKAQSLYQALGLSVELLEVRSVEGLVSLIKRKSAFDLIYIDGLHEGLQPAVDFGLATILLKSGGILMLDDHAWADVKPIKALCDAHGELVAESWKIAAYRLNG